LRDGLRDELGRADKRPKNWDRRWDEAVKTLDDVARCYRVLHDLIEVRRKALPELLRQGFESTDDPWQRLMLVAIASKSEQYFGEWQAYCRVQEKTTMARKALQPLVREFYLTPPLKRGAQKNVIERKMREGFRFPLVRAANQIQFLPLQKMLQQRARSIQR